MADVYYYVNQGPIDRRDPSVTREQGKWSLNIDVAYSGKLPGNPIDGDGLRVNEGDQFFTADPVLQAAIEKITYDTDNSPVFLIEQNPTGGGWFDLDSYLGLP